VFVTHDQVEAMTLGDRIVVMKDGLMQQVGSPLELYRRPVNRFVASFIGSPAMNFIDMRVAAGSDTFSLSSEGISIALPQRRFPGLGAHAGRTVTMGVRPQHMRLGSANGGEQVAFGGNLMVTEQLGDEQVLAVRIGQGDIRVAGVDPELTLATGSRIDVAVPLENLHLFDTATGAAIR
jgi:multiple sugar transport system ATP-binding protein